MMVQFSHLGSTTFFLSSLIKRLQLLFVVKTYRLASIANRSAAIDSSPAAPSELVAAK
eukprot:CAMPEP_0119025508 /NCGR_PEP_ID=MMETSP1176-20130426/33875_1 /TAXON_ID=265551 /ORGANISM="Synedropsis recta cf, Strain CCMP1620" /LENGTH=57 /DNA_ID=CAMNT_0006981055 /DNA_START=44 /DNA_END=214 /DNA_ORIENTATION=+